MKTFRRSLKNPMILPDATMIKMMVNKTGYRAAFRYLREVLGYDKNEAKELVRQLV